MPSISGQEYLYNLHRNAETGSDRQIFFQNAIAAFAGLMYFLISMGQVMRGDAVEMTALHVLYLAAPAVVIALCWAAAALVIFRSMRRRAVQAARHKFSSTDLAIILMQPQLPENLRPPERSAAAARYGMDKGDPAFKDRLDWLQAEFELICYRLGVAGRPWQRTALDVLLIIVAMVGIVLVMIPGYHPLLFLAGLGLILVAINAKLIREAARAYAIRLALFEVFSGQHQED